MTILTVKKFLRGLLQRLIENFDRFHSRMRRHIDRVLFFHGHVILDFGCISSRLCKHLGRCRKRAFGSQLLRKRNEFFLGAECRKGIDLLVRVDTLNGRLAIDAEVDHGLLRKVALNADKGDAAQLGGFFVRGHHVVAVDTPLGLQEDNRRTMRTT